MDVSQSGPMFASLGYDFLAVTDHNKAPDETQWSNWQEQNSLLVVPGEENGQTDHILEIGVHEVTQTTGAGNYAERAAALVESGGFVAGCHPQEYPHGEDNIRTAVNTLHAFELFNGLREQRGCDEWANVRLWDELLTAGHPIWGIATDDFHCQYTSPGNGWVCVQIDEEVEPEWPVIVEQLKAGAFYASTYPAFEQIGLHDNTLVVDGDHWAQELAVIGPGGVELTRVDGPHLEWDPPEGLSYYRVEARSGTKRAWSQPFYGE
jgi:hypothetical protein